MDGFGVLHPRRLGSASHLGVLAGLPTVGVAKSLLHVSEVVFGEGRAGLLGAAGMWGEGSQVSSQVVGVSN